MIDRCANPACEAPFRYFRGGKIFVLSPRERGASNSHRNVEHFWLCHKCAPVRRLVVDEAGNARVQALVEDARADTVSLRPCA